LELGIEIVPVWNKSNREHLIVGSEPSETRRAADAAVAGLAWPRSYFLDADHVGMKTVDRFIPPCDFFTIDVADKIGSLEEASDIRSFTERHPELLAEIVLEPSGLRFDGSLEVVENVAQKYLAAIQEAGKIYRYVAERKGVGQFVSEISMDETDSPQTPLELLIILAAIADEQVPVQTIAPKFSGRFNKGVDYRGNVEAFTREFTADLAVLAHATRIYDLPGNLKLSVHSGSDKFSLYRPIHHAITDARAGIHLKTAGTTWLAELAGLALAGGAGLELAKEIYVRACEHMDELCAPYASVIEIDRRKLPEPEAVKRWSSREYFDALNHDSNCSSYNSDLRQLLHVSFKIAAKMSDRFTGAVLDNEALIADGVTENLFERHIRPVFFPD
ncbi:MAG: tagaturonate epimerase family protein, partial [Candidatus Acidiferrum sp.]